MAFLLGLFCVDSYKAKLLESLWTRRHTNDVCGPLDAGGKGARKGQAGGHELAAHWHHLGRVSTRGAHAPALLASPDERCSRAHQRSNCLAVLMRVHQLLRDTDKHLTCEPRPQPFSSKEWKIFDSK